MENIHDYLIHCNTYTEIWSAFKRDAQGDYFNGTLDKKEIIQDKDYNKVIEKLKKMK